MITLQFGAYAPDKAQDPVQMPDSQGPVVVPCVDVNNVYYANGTYRNIQSPAAVTVNGNTVSPLLSQVLSAFSYFDTVAQQETVFAGMSDGIQMLTSNGTWMTVPINGTTQVSLTGLSMSFTSGTFLNTDVILSGAAAFTIGTLTPSVTGVSIVAGNSPALSRVGYDLITGTSSIGSVNNQTLSFGTLVAVYDQFTGGQPLQAAVIVVSPTDPTSSAFTTLTANGRSLKASTASYSYKNSHAMWLFPSGLGLAAGQTYAVNIT